jgi:hypothetical protein
VLILLLAGYPSQLLVTASPGHEFLTSTLGQPVLVSGTHLGPKTRFVLLSDSCGFVNVTRGRICPLQLLLALTRAITLGSEYRGTHEHISLSQIRNAPNLEGQVPVFMPPPIPRGKGWRSYTPYWLAQPQSQLLCDWPSTANHFLLAPSSLRLKTRDFFL